ncbi:MAG: hypothetical protein ACR2GA_00145, partial [Chloroflexota bacterium]
MTVTRAAFLAALVLLVAGIAFGRAWVVTWTAPAFSPPAPIAVRVITATPLPRVSHRVARAATKKPHPSPRHTQPVHHHAVATPRPTPTPTVAMPSPSPTPTRPVLAYPLRHPQPHRKLATHRHIHRRPRATAR